MKKDPTDFSTVEVLKVLFYKNIGTKKIPKIADTPLEYYLRDIKEAKDFVKTSVPNIVTICDKTEIIKFKLLNKRNCKGSLRDTLNTWED